MAAAKGRTILFSWNGGAILGLQEKDLELNGALIDITSDENGGWRTLLDVSAQDEVNLTLSGVTKDRVLKDAWNSGARTAPCVMTDPDGTVLSGMFYLASYKEKASFKDARTFDVTLNSTGAITYTPGS